MNKNTRQLIIEDLQKQVEEHVDNLMKPSASYVESTSRLLGTLAGTTIQILKMLKEMD